MQERLKDILSLVEDIELSMDSTRTHKDKTQQEIDKVVENIFGRLNDQLRRKLQRLTGMLGGVTFIFKYSRLRLSLLKICMYSL